MNLKVLYVTGALPPIPCGVGCYSEAILNKLSNNNNLDLLCFSLYDGKEVYTKKKFNYYRCKTTYLILQLIEYIKIIIQFKPSIIHIQIPAAGYSRFTPCLLLIIGFIFGKRLVQTWHEKYFCCKQLNFINLLLPGKLILIRSSTNKDFPFFYKFLKIHEKTIEIGNDSTIPIIDYGQRIQFFKNNFKKKNYINKKKIISFFGSCNRNSELKVLLKSLDPSKHFLLLLTSIDNNIDNKYKKEIQDILSEGLWEGSYLLSGYISELKIAKFLKISDAVVITRLNSSPIWSTSFKAALDSGNLVVSYINDSAISEGYDNNQNLYLLKNMKNINRVISRFYKIKKSKKRMLAWNNIAESHYSFYLDFFN